MITEQIISWFFSVLSHVISLVPAIGHTLDLNPNSSLALLKVVGVLNGYVPMTEIGIVFGICLGIFGVFQLFLLLHAAWVQLTAVIP